MKKFIYSQHDEIADFFNHPMISEIEPEAFKSNIERSIILCKDKTKVEMIESCKLVFLGTFDDVTGKFDIKEKPELLLDCDNLIRSRGLSNGETN